MKTLTLKRYISEPVSVHFAVQPTHSKTPPCPDSFTWQGQEFHIKTCLYEWKDFSRRGRMAQNMQPQHAQTASKQGSWGVGKFYFDVQTEEDRYFRLYYDRAPKNAFDHRGVWILLAELGEG